MRTINKAALALTASLFLAACSPGMYTGGGWTETATELDNNANFSFSVDVCNDESMGHFSLNDEKWRIPVEINGRVTDFSEQGDFGDDCSFYGQLEYVSSNPDYPGEGQAVVCFGEQTETSGDGLSGHVWVTVQSGPFEAYENYGPIYGTVQEHSCET